jgi:hypothetical protein
MSRGAQSFRQGDVTKAVKDVVNAGMQVGRAEIEAGEPFPFLALNRSRSNSTDFPRVLGACLRNVLRDTAG